ncbi:IS3 family transposase [Anoxybacillus flavithermus]
MKTRDKTVFYSIIHDLSCSYPISLLCKIACVSRSGYYKWLKRRNVTTARDLRNQDIMNLIVEAYEVSNGTYGYPRVKAYILREYGWRINHKCIYRLMKRMNLQAKIRRKKQVYRKGSERITVPNVLNRQFTASKPNEKWVTDITYLLLNNQRLYLSVIYDLFNREVISYRISKRNDVQLVLDTLDEAIKKRDVNGTILHSDQGFQYTSHEYHAALQQHGIIPSMSRKANCLDNACIENFFSHLKTECIYLGEFHSMDDLEAAVHKYIEFYNNRRIQKKLTYLSPVQYRKKVCA